MIERWKIIKKCFVWQTNCNLDFARANETWRAMRNDIELHILHIYNYLQIYILTFFKLVSQFAIVRSLPRLLLLLLLLLVSPQRCREILILEDTQHAICKRYAGKPYARQGRPNNGEWLQPTELVAL